MNNDIENQIKGSKAILDEFFKELIQVSDIEPEIVALVASLHSEGKFTSTNMIQLLDDMKEQKLKNGQKQR